MSKNKKKDKEQKNNEKGTNGLIKNFMDIVYTKITFKSGRVNLTCGFFLLVVLCFILVAPVTEYLLKMVQYICNTVLLLFDKTTIPIETKDFLWTPLIILLVLLLFFESFVCFLIIHWSEKVKPSKK